MLESLADIFSSEMFMPHGHCYLWTPGLLWLQAVTNGLIGAAYFAIAVTLGWMVHRAPFLPFRGMALAFGAFIISCGFTHFFDVLVIWEPVYWTDGAVRAVTAVASVGTAVLLPPLVPQAIALARGARAAREQGVALTQMLRDMERVYEETRRLDRLKTQFFANVSHELRTPLALVMGPVERLLGAENLTDDQRRDLDLVLRNAHSLLKHVNDLLDVSRLEAGKADLRYARVDAGRLVRRVAANFDALAAERGVAYTVEAAERLSAELDPAKIERIVLNLLSNAFKFTPPGGRIRCSVRPVDDRLRIEVADSGPGIPTDMRELVFERFEQLDGGVTRRFGGTGLGLAICRDFVRLHRGRIDVHDAPEGGALLVVELPRRAPEEAEVAAAPPPDAEAADAARHALEELRTHDETRHEPSAPEGAPLVLVVEDNPDMRRFLCRTLAADHRTEEARDGREGLEKTRSLRPDLVITDVMMPEMSGEELVHAVRREPALDDIPIVVLTAKADDVLRARLLREGAQDHLTKPFGTEELRARVGNLVAMKRARDVLQRELATRARDLEAMARELGRRRREIETALETARVARDRAEEASRVKSDFLSLVSHELRTPLTAIHLQLEALGADPELADHQRALVDRLRTSARRLTALIDTLLEYTRVARAHPVVERVTFDLPELLAAVIDEVRPEADEKGLTLALDTPPDLPPMTSDPRLVRLVILNLVANAVRFTERGEVRVRLEHDGAAHRLVVSDTGPGIPPELRDRVFEPFVTGEPTRFKHRPGFGLGLTLVREITRTLGGGVHLESAPGRGSIFTVVLPSATSEAGPW